MGEALPLCDSPRGMLCNIWDAVVSFFKKFRWAHRSGEPVVKGNEVWWFVFSSLPCICLSDACYQSLEVGPILSELAVGVLNLISMPGFYVIHIAVVHHIIYWHRDMPSRIIGAKVRFMAEVIPMITAAALHHLLEFNWAYIDIVVSCTGYFYFVAHFMNAAYDIGFLDVLLGSAMPVLVYLVNGEILVRALVTSFCLVLSICRFITYSAPEIPPHGKKELKRLPC